jgi:flagellar hook-associated protein 1 FlgK
MANLLSSLLSSATALSAYTQVLQVTQNNVANASTPGYAKQSQSLYALPFDPSLGCSGGVRAGEIQSARNQYAEQSVRRQTVLLGQAQQNANSLTALQSLFDISGNSGIPSALNSLFQSFSAWGQAPADTIARQNVVTCAGQVAGAFQQAAVGLGKVAQDTERQIQQTVDQINQLAGQIKGYNARILQGARNDAGVDAGLNQALEELSGLGDITALYQADGSVSVLLNGETALVVGDRQYSISYGLQSPAEPPPVNPDARPQAGIFASDGSDITAKTTGGQLGALLDIRNRVLPSYLGDAYQAGDLNVMAKQFADCVNQLLTSGYISDGSPPDAGVALFTYDTGNDTNVAQTLAVDPAVTPDRLAAIDPGPPYTANGIPLALAGLSDPQDPAGEIDGASFTEYYGDMASRIGAQLNDATNVLQSQQSMVAQAKELRDQMSGVSLDEEAMMMIQFQRAYEANSRLITILNQLTQDTINILQ